MVGNPRKPGMNNVKPVLEINPNNKAEVMEQIQRSVIHDQPVMLSDVLAILETLWDMSRNDAHRTAYAVAQAQITLILTGKELYV